MQKRKKTGIILEDLNASQVSYYAIKNINKYLEDSLDDFVLFFESAGNSVIQPQCSSMGINELWSFDGTAIATTVSTCLSLAQSHSTLDKYFYVWDLEWSRPRGVDYDYIVTAFNNPEIKLIARSKDHAKAIKNYCNRDVCGVVPNFCVENLMKVINNE
tara:strand:- start:405 stop:881 length:477 start_codon:yes stop_codon:yes gene_type:complete